MISRGLNRTGPGWCSDGGSDPSRTVGGMAAKSDPAGIDAVEPLADSTAGQARRLVAANADNAEECRAFLSMLGIGLATLVEA